jgi:uncharacterized protein (DUF58 family)
VAARLTSNIRAHARDWALRRQGTDVLPKTLAASRVYILPTRPGWIFALLVVVLFIAGMNYGNGLALLFAFWMAGFALVAMVQTQRNLAGTRIVSVSAEPVFVGECVAISVAAAARGAVADLALSTDEGAATPSISVPDGALRLQIATHRRGRWQAPALRLSCTAPFGLFRTWTWLSLDLSVLVYPRPAGTLPMPGVPGEDGGDGSMSSEQEDFAWLRNYRAGDSPRQVAWKAYARGAPLLVREYRGRRQAALEFDFSALQNPDTEARLSQLTRWCIEAASRGDAWTLRLPGCVPLAGQGAAQLELCLRKLALHGLPDTA